MGCLYFRRVLLVFPAGVCLYFRRACACISGACALVFPMRARWNFRRERADISGACALTFQARVAYISGACAFTFRAFCAYISGVLRVHFGRFARTLQTRARVHFGRFVRTFRAFCAYISDAGVLIFQAHARLYFGCACADMSGARCLHFGHGLFACTARGLWISLGFRGKYRHMGVGNNRTCVYITGAV